MQLGVMLEGQEGLTWDLWRRIMVRVEELGFESLWRSDHFMSPEDSSRDAIETWVALTLTAAETTRLRFGPLVSPMTFRHPSLLARMAAAVDTLSAGRLVLGLGAGWNEHEHRAFGIPFPPLKERMDRFECGARVIRALWRGRPVTLDQPYYPLREAQSYPLPPGGGVPLVVGGRGERRTLRIVAEHADEWNLTRVTPDEYATKCRVLEEHCRAVGRDPATIRRSLMVPIVTGRTSAEVTARLARARATFSRLPEDPAEWLKAGFLYGTIAEVRDGVRRWEEAGMHRLMLQVLDMTDLEMIRFIGQELAR